jgi:hypothetical protein
MSVAIYGDSDDLLRKLAPLGKKESTRRLTQFFVSARFKHSDDIFQHQYADGANDGGIDYYNHEDGTFYIIQTKFESMSSKLDENSIDAEINKLEKTITKENPNTKAQDFVNSLRARLLDPAASLEIILVTTNEVTQSVRDSIQEHLQGIRRKNAWRLSVDFVAIDKSALDSVIYDLEHGYVPATGKRVLSIENGKFIENTGESTGVYSVVCSVRLDEMLSWFDSSSDVGQFLQKNIRGYVGETVINKKIAKSFVDYPDWFWYKHNGIIVFADSISVDKTKSNLILRNPQIVNGGQTLKALFKVYDKGGRRESDASVLFRAYKLHYENAATYQTSIDIIAGLNSQNPIRPSDLHSTDPRQVMLETHLRGLDYMYYRKREKEAHVSKTHIRMTNLALLYYICKRQAPQEGVRGNVEEIFSETSKYNDVFPESEINQELKSSSHIALRYITVWNLFEMIKDIRWEVPKRDQELAPYTQYFVLVDTYHRLWEWKQRNFELRGWRNWKSFIESSELSDNLWGYCRIGFSIGPKMIPRSQEPRKFLRRKEAAERYDSRTSSRQFVAAINKAYRAFESTLD